MAYVKQRNLFLVVKKRWIIIKYILLTENIRFKLIYDWWLFDRTMSDMIQQRYLSIR